VAVEAIAQGEEFAMYPKRRSSALLALLAAGGLYAWRNRDKIQGWINRQTTQYNNQDNTTFPSTGATRRIDAGLNRADTETPLSERRFGSEI
jgi:hypothetical protein